ncbi:hypothetical protein [Nonomuraea aridisoli]|nr:hypothetical protein [Nonomuraea aridisoli]
MRRISMILCPLAVAAALAVPQAAQAAEGVLIINEESFVDPSGCYPISGDPLYITNRTDTPVYVHYGENCTGAIVTVVGAGESQASQHEEGKSFRIR